MRVADHGGLGDLRMQYQGTFPLGGAHAMTGNIEHIVHPASDPIITAGVAPGAITGKVIAGVDGIVGLDTALMIAVYGAQLGGPGSLDRQVSRTHAFNFTPFIVQ